MSQVDDSYPDVEHVDCGLDSSWEIYKAALDYCAKAAICARQIEDFNEEDRRHELSDLQGGAGLYVRAARSLIEISGVNPPESVGLLLDRLDGDLKSNRGVFQPISVSRKAVVPSEDYLAARKEGRILYYVDGKKVLVKEGELVGNSRYAQNRRNPQVTIIVEPEPNPEPVEHPEPKKPEITKSQKRNAEYLTTRIIDTINTNYREDLTEDDFRTIYVTGDKITKTEEGFYLVMSRVYGVDAGKCHGTLSRQDSPHGKIKVLSGRGDYREVDIFSPMTEFVYRTLVNEMKTEGGELPDTWRGEDRQWTYTILSDSIYSRAGPVKVARVVKGKVVISQVVKNWYQSNYRFRAGVKL